MRSAAVRGTAISIDAVVGGWLPGDFGPRGERVSRRFKVYTPEY